MTHTKQWITMAGVALAAAACGGSSGGGGSTITPPPPTSGPTASQYVNPVLNADFPDPGVVRAADGTYYAYATQTTGLRIQVSHSTDLVTWNTPAEALPVKPGWASNSQNFWAPDVNLRESGTYVMYFAAQADSTNGGFCVGMATSTNPAGPFTDVGHPVVCGPAASTIDPQGFDDPQTGARYLLWGSGGYPIRIQRLSPTARDSVVAGSSSTAILSVQAGQPYESQLVEAPWMTYHAPYYYLFFSAGNCCNQFGPVNYAVLVARASSPTGPFTDLGGSSPVLAAGGRFVGPGHNAVVTVNGADYMLYHAVDLNNPFLAGTSNVSRRVLLLDRITYQANGWPIVGSTGTPTATPQSKPGQ